MHDICKGIYNLQSTHGTLEKVGWMLHHVGDLYTNVPPVTGLTYLNIEGNTPSIFDSLDCPAEGVALFSDVRHVKFDCSDIDLDEGDIRCINATIGPHTESLDLHITIYMETLFPLFATFRSAIQAECCRHGQRSAVTSPRFPCTFTILPIPSTM